MHDSLARTLQVYIEPIFWLARTGSLVNCRLLCYYCALWVNMPNLVVQGQTVN